MVRLLIKTMSTSRAKARLNAENSTAAVVTRAAADTCGCAMENVRISELLSEVEELDDEGRRPYRKRIPG